MELLISFENARSSEMALLGWREVLHLGQNSHWPHIGRCQPLPWMQGYPSCPGKHRASIVGHQKGGIKPGLYTVSSSQGVLWWGHPNLEVKRGTCLEQLANLPGLVKMGSTWQDPVSLRTAGRSRENSLLVAVLKISRDLNVFNKNNLVLLAY